MRRVATSCDRFWLTEDPLSVVRTTCRQQRASVWNEVRQMTMTNLRGSFVPPVPRPRTETVLHVRPFGERWQVSRDDEPPLVVRTKAAAVTEAGRRAREARPSRIVVHTPDDGVEAEATYALP